MLLANFAHKHRASCCQLQQLAGKLSWVLHVVNGGKVYLQCMLDLLRPLQLLHHKVRLTAEFQADIQWWISCLEVFNTRHLLQNHDLVVPILLMPALRVQECYLHWVCGLESRCSPNGQELINVKETMAVILALYHWALYLLLNNKTVVIYTNNITTRANLTKGACKTTS